MLTSRISAEKRYPFYKNANRAPSSKTTPFFVKSGTRIRALLGPRGGAGGEISSPHLNSVEADKGVCALKQ